MDGLDLFVEVVLLLGAFHLLFHAGLDGAVHVELFDLNVQHVGDAGEALSGIEDFEQFLLFFDRELQVGGDGVGEFGRVFHADGGDHGLVVQRLAELDVLFEQGSDALHCGFERRGRLRGGASHADGGLEKAFCFNDLQDAGAFHAFDQDFDIAVGQLEALHDVDDGADFVDFVGLRLVNAGVVLGGEEDLFVARQSFFEGANAGLATDHERRHHERENDHVPDGHHGQLLAFKLLFRLSQGFLSCLYLPWLTAVGFQLAALG